MASGVSSVPSLGFHKGLVDALPIFFSYLAVSLTQPTQEQAVSPM